MYSPIARTIRLRQYRATYPFQVEEDSSYKPYMALMGFVVYPTKHKYDTVDFWKENLHVYVSLL